MAEATNTISVAPLAGRIGALISGVDVSQALPKDKIESIRAALLRYKVVFLRDQTLDYDSHVAFASEFGEVTMGHPIFTAPDSKPFLREFDSRTGIRANHWHSDLTFLPQPPAFAFSRSVVAPSAGGDTMWSNGVAAYNSMPEDLRAFANTLRIVHSNDCDYIDATMFAGKKDYVATPFEAEHSAVQKHPETGDLFLLLGGFARYVVGYDPSASRSILNLLQHYAELPENTIRWPWRAGDIAVWDNLATQHYAVYDYGDAKRLNDRVTVLGHPLSGVDGRASVSLTPMIEAAD